MTTINEDFLAELYSDENIQSQVEKVAQADVLDHFLAGSDLDIADLDAEDLYKVASELFGEDSEFVEQIKEAGKLQAARDYLSSAAGTVKSKAKGLYDRKTAPFRDKAMPSDKEISRARTEGERSGPALQLPGKRKKRGEAAVEKLKADTIARNTRAKGLRRKAMGAGVGAAALAGGGAAGAAHLSKESHDEKLAEMDYLGRYMAHAFNDELHKIAAEDDGEGDEVQVKEAFDLLAQARAQQIAEELGLLE